MSSEELSADEVLQIVSERVSAVLGLDGTDVGAATRFDEDLHADSLDLVEVVESVERVLQQRGFAVSVPDDELLAVQTVGEAAERIRGGLGG